MAPVIDKAVEMCHNPQVLAALLMNKKGIDISEDTNCGIVNMGQEKQLQVTKFPLILFSLRMATKFDLDTPYSVKLLDRSEWEQDESACMAKRISWYTDGSKMTTSTGVGICSARPKICKSRSLGSKLLYFKQK